MMKAWVARGGGLHLEDVPEPLPGSDELLLQVRAVSLNRGEIRAVTRAGDGVVPGWDVAGTVVTAAASGKGPPEGARVAAVLSAGGWAELARVPVEQAASGTIAFGIDGLQALHLAMKRADAVLQSSKKKLEWLGQSEDLGMPKFLPELPKPHQDRFEAMVEREAAKVWRNVARARKAKITKGPSPQAGR